MPLAFSCRRVHWLLPAILLLAITGTVWRHEFTYSVLPTAPKAEQTGKEGGHAKDAGEQYTPASAPHTKPAQTWNFDLQRDELNFGLSNEQCQIHGPTNAVSYVAFPDLYYELDRAHDHLLKQNRKLKEEDVQLYVIKEVKGDPDRSRGLAALANMYRALTAIPNPRSIPNIEFVFGIEDKADLGETQPDRVRWAWARPQDNPWLWVMPDFDRWAYPNDGVGGYVNFRDDMRNVEAEFKERLHDKEAKLSWRGSLAVNTDLRQALVVAAENKSRSDVEAIDWHNRSYIMAMTDFCRDHVPVIHKLEYVAHYYPLLKESGPHQNSVKVERDWSDLDETMKALLKNRSSRTASPPSRRAYSGPVSDAGGRGLPLAEDVPQLEAGHSVRAQEKYSFEHGFLEPDLQDGNE
ncbi:hypothetical protein DL765_007306 [Monosporascus sp. GIB2]|nr:hypothetical protein DL765_007306 [Monosporascus sp. GIB2]